MEIFLSDGIIVDADSNEAVGYVPWYDMNEYVQRLFGQNILIAVCSCRALALLCQMLALMWVLNMAVLWYIGNETGNSRSL